MSRERGSAVAALMAAAVGPALIVVLVYSLVAFLVEVVYNGQYSSRLLWIMFFFIAGVTLVARISIEEGARRAQAYGLALAIPTFIALQSFVSYDNTPLRGLSVVANLGLLAVGWWSVHKLTVDCTHTQDERRMAGSGILHAAGLDRGEPEDEPDADSEARPDETKTWWQRYQAHKTERAKRPTTPGTWVVYFALATLPLFGLGGALIDPADAARRDRAGWLLAMYLASALALLVVTSFIGLWRYLQQVGASTGKSLPAVWLGAGAAFVLVVVALAMILPRPYAEASPWKLARFGSPQLAASSNAMMSDSPAEGQGKPGESDNSSNQKPRQGQSEGQGKSGEKGQGKSEGKGKGDQPKGENSSRSDASQKRSDEESKKDEKKSQGSGFDDSPKAEQQGNKSGGQQGEKKGDGKSGEKKSDDKGQKPEDKPGSQPDRSPSQALNQLLTLIKWIVFIVLAVVVVCVAVYFLLKHLAQFTQWARNLLDALRKWWQGLFSGADVAKTATPSSPPPAPSRPFAAFANPFTSGAATGRPTDELTRYTFAALEAWARERRTPRGPGETPYEFAHRLIEQVPAAEDVAKPLVGLVARAEYAGGPLPGQARVVLQQVWDRLDELARR